MTKSTSVSTAEVESNSSATHPGTCDTSTGETIVEYKAEKRQGRKIKKLLPEDVIEKIIARLPFHFLFQARLLAKRWASIIVSSRSFETFFQREIVAHALSATWDAYCPAHVGLDGLTGYNVSANRWERILSLSYLPISETEFSSYKLGNIAGALISLYLRKRQSTNKLNVWVTNPLNQSWNLIHPFSLTRSSQIVLVHLGCVGSHAYKVIVITVDHILVEGPDPEVFLGAQVYDSACNCWTRYYPCTEKMGWMDIVMAKWNSALFENSLYLMGQVLFCEPLLLAYNITDETWSRIKIFAPQPDRKMWAEALLFQCASKIVVVNMMVVDGRCIVTIHELHHSSQITYESSEDELEGSALHTFMRCDQLTTLQLPFLFTSVPTKVASDGKSLYIFGVGDGSAACDQLDVRVFDVGRQFWSNSSNSSMIPSHLSVGLVEVRQWARSAFQPGLNPFVEA